MTESPLKTFLDWLENNEFEEEARIRFRKVKEALKTKVEERISKWTEALNKHESTCEAPLTCTEIQVLISRIDELKDVLSLLEGETKS